MTSTLLEGVTRANAEYTLKYLLRDPALAAPAKALLERLPRESLTEPLHTAAQMADWASRRIGQLAPQLGPATHRFLSTHLTGTRDGEPVEWRYGLQRMPFPTRVAGAAGALFDVSEVTRTLERYAKDHSIHDVKSYVDEWLPPFVTQELARGEAELWLVESDREEGLARAHADGFTKAFRIECPGAFGSNELYLALNEKTGARRYFFASVQGDSALATLLHVTGMSGTTAPVKLLSAVQSRESAQALAAFQLLRPYAKADGAIIGFKNSLERIVWKRRLLTDARPQLEAWSARVGLTPLTLPDLSGRLPTHDETNVLRARLEELSTSALTGTEAKALLAKLEGPPAIAAPPPTGTNPVTWDGSMLSVVSKTGEPKTLALLRTPYGDTAGSFVEALSSLGVTNLGLIGTAGGLEADARIGDIHVPTSVVERDGVARTFVNAAAPYLSDGEGVAIREGGTGSTISTPLAETRAEVERLKTRGDDFVELELSSIDAAAQRSGATVGAAFVISDIPGSAETIERQAPGVLDEAVSRSLDGLLQSLGVADVRFPVPEPAQPEAPATVEQRLSALADAAGLSGAARRAFVTEQASVFSTQPTAALDVPAALLLQRGAELQRTMVGFLAGVALTVPGTEGRKLLPEREYPLEASDVDALALSLIRAQQDSARSQPADWF